MITGQNPLVFVNLLVSVFVLGIFAAGKLQMALPFLYGVIVFLVICSGVCLFYSRKEAGYGLLLLFFFLGFMRCSHDAALSSSDISNSTLKSVTAIGSVVDTPRVKEAEDQNSVRYVIEVAQLRQAQQDVPVSGKAVVYVTQKKSAAIARYGDQLVVRGEIKALHGYQNPGMIDTVAALERQGITAKLQAVKDGAVIQPNRAGHFRRSVDEIRAKILRYMEEVMPKQDAAALFAMLFGGYTGIKPELLEAFTATGIVHILSVSGSHITLLAGTLQWLGALLRLRPMAVAAVIIFAVSVYAVFAGCVPPVLRSAAMGILTFVALALGREKDARHTLALVCLLILAFQPRLIYDISFQLSFAATVGLLYLSPLLRQALIKLPGWLAGNLAITIAAQLSVLPFLAWYFHSVSLSALLANLVAVPLVELIIIGGLLAVVLGVCLPFLQNIIFIFCSLSIGLVYNMTNVIAALPGGNLSLPSGGLVPGVIFYGLLFFFIWCVRTKRAFCKTWLKRYHRQAALGGIALIAILFWLSRQPAPLRVHFIDVGQGDALLLTTPRGKAVVIDTGGVLASLSDFDVGARVVVPYLKHYGVQEIEYLILTHAHDDHAGGASALRRSFPVRHVLIGREDRREYAKVFKTSLESCNSFIPAYTGQEIVLDGVRLEVVQAMDGTNNRTGNEASNVIKISYGVHDFLVTGDLDAAGEQKLLAGGANIGSTVLKVGHHGSKTSSTENFVQRVKPQYAVISVGADNRFGHPNQAVVERLRQNQAEVLRTDQSGAIVFASDGKTLRVETFVEE